MTGRRRRLRMRALLVAAAAALMAPLVAAPPALAAEDPQVQARADAAALVNPLIGTANGGNVFPGAVLPLGMASFSPENSRGNQTRTAAPGGYLYSATKIRGFSLTHLSGTGCAGASGDIPFFPYAGDVTTSPSADTTVHWSGKTRVSAVPTNTIGSSAMVIPGRSSVPVPGRT